MILPKIVPLVVWAVVGVIKVGVFKNKKVNANVIRTAMRHSGRRLL